MPGKSGNSEKMGEVRKQVATLLGAAQQGELFELKEFLATFAEAQLAEERKSFGLGPGDESDEDDYPEGHFKDHGEGRGGGAATKPGKPGKAARLLSHQRDALRDFKDGNGRTALHFAASSNASGVVEVASHILSTCPAAHGVRDDDGATPLVLAAAVKGPYTEAMVRLLLEKGAQPDACDKSGVQATHHAASAGHVALLDLLHHAGSAEAGGSRSLCVETTACASGSPLHWASGEGETDAVRALVRLGAPLDATNAQGLTPIIMACASGSDGCVAALAEAGADTGHVLGGGLTVLHVCADCGLAQGAAAVVATPTGAACALRPDAKGNLPIHLAAAAGHRGVVALLHPHSFVPAAASTPSPHSVEQLMADGAKAAAAAAEEQAQGAAAAGTAGGLPPLPPPSNLIENTAPAADGAAAAAAQGCKDEGNAAFKRKDFAAAAERYTAAVLLDGTDAVFFSNRSACWLELANQASKEEEGAAPGPPPPPPSPSSPPSSSSSLRARAVADAEQCRRLKPDWAKGCFRLASARLASGKYEDAALAAFEGLKLDDASAPLKALLKQAVAKGREAHFGGAGEES